MPYLQAWPCPQRELAGNSCRASWLCGCLHARGAHRALAHHARELALARLPPPKALPRGQRPLQAQLLCLRAQRVPPLLRIVHFDCRLRHGLCRHAHDRWLCLPPCRRRRRRRFPPLLNPGGPGAPCCVGAGLRASPRSDGAGQGGEDAQGEWEARAAEHAPLIRGCRAQAASGKPHKHADDCQLQHGALRSGRRTAQRLHKLSTQSLPQPPALRWVTIGASNTQRERGEQQHPALSGNLFLSPAPHQHTLGERPAQPAQLSASRPGTPGPAALPAAHPPPLTRCRHRSPTTLTTRAANMNPEMVKMAQDMMAKMSPEQVCAARQRRQDTGVQRCCSTALMHCPMCPLQMAQMQRQMQDMPPEMLQQAMSMAQSATPEQLARMRAAAQDLTPEQLAAQVRRRPRAGRQGRQACRVQA